MTGRAVAVVVCLLLLAVAGTATVIAVALLATDLDRHGRALAVLPVAAVLGVVAGWVLLAPRRGAR